MAEIAEDAASVAAAAANMVISEIVSAMLDSATTSAAKAAASPGMPQDISGLKDGSVAPAGIAETVSSIIESATTAAVAATQEQEYRTAVVAEGASASAAATTSVPPLSPLGPTVEHTASGIELSGRRGCDDEEGSEIDGLRRNDAATAHVADRSPDRRRQVEPVVILDAVHLVDNEAEAKDGSEGGSIQDKAEENNSNRMRQAQTDEKENWEGKDVEENEKHEEEQLKPPEECKDHVSRSVRVVDDNGYRTDRSRGSINAVQAVIERSGKAESQHSSGGRADHNSQAAGECSTAPNDRPSAGTPAAPQIAPSQLPEGEGDIQQQWQWWDNQNPWSRSPRSSISSDRKTADRKLSDTGPPPPVYQETTPPPPYQEVVAGLRASRSSTQKQTLEQQEGARSSETVTSNRGAHRSATAVSHDASGSSGDTSRGPPPSYGAAVVARTASRYYSRDREEEEQTSVRHLPPPSYGRFYDDFRSATFTSPLKGETDGSGAKSDGDEWWTKGNEDHQYAPVWGGEGRTQERESGRRRTRASSGGTGSSGGGGDVLKNDDRPETVGDEHEEERLGGASWRRRQHSEGRTRRTVPTSGSGRPKTTMPHPRGKIGDKDSTLSGTESWDDDRWRLTRYLQSCKRELAEAEERRRRAEAAANAAERNAWAAGNSKDGEDEGAKRAWARAATQKVLDLMLVTERVRQEEQKRRVAAARANNQVARCKQPFRERRGRSQKGAFIGPSVPPADVLEPPRSQQRTEAAAMRDIYWDEHGRRYSRRGSTGDGSDGQDRTSGEVGVALEIVRKVAHACLEEDTDFGQPFREIDSDGDGRLTLAELGAALRRAGARLNLSQITALFRHFDEGLGLDTVCRGQFLWEFVDTKHLVKQWRKAGGVLGGHRARMAPFRTRAKKASYGGGRVGDDDGMLSRNDVLRSLADLGIHVDGWEADALLDRFAVEDGSNNVDWLAFVSFMQAAENKDNGSHNDNSGNSPSNGTKSAAKGRRERAGPRTSLSRHSQRHERHWATSGLHRGGGLFEGEGTIAASGRPSCPTKRTTPNVGGKPYHHWASSAPPSGGGWRQEGADDGGEIDPTTRSRSRTGSAGRRPSAEAILEGSSPPPSLRSRAPRGGRGARGGGLVTNAAEASRMLDGLLENQQELEAFLEEEIAKREREGGLRREGGFARRRGVV